MPIFEYRCERCTARFDLLAASRAVRPAHPACPKCGAKQTTAVLSAPALGRSNSAGAACDVRLGGG